MIELWNGDCLQEMRRIPKGSVNMVLCDPPFGTTLMNWDRVLPFDQLWAAYEYTLAPGGIVVLFGSQPFTSALVMSNAEWFKYELIWDKNKCGSPGLAKIRPMKTHENILVFAPGRSTYNPQMTVGEPYSRKSSNPEGYVGRENNHKYGLKPRTEFSNEGTRYPKSVLNISRDFSAQQQVHPTQKAVPLLEWLIKTYSNEGDLVLDNTMGSGSTGVAAVRLKRSFIGIEQDKKYFNIATERINKEIQNDI
jgi:DNA modification methylase